MTLQYVVCAANRNEQTGLIICGARHWDNIMCAVVDALGESPLITGDDPWEQGFIDQYGKFLTREEAADIITLNEQKLNGDLNYFDFGMCFSENLY